MSGTVGVVGMGIMGGAMASNLAMAGWTVHGYDVDEARKAEARNAGVAVEDSIGAVAAKVPTIIMSMPNPKVAIGVAHEIAAASGRIVVVETSTLALDDKMEIERILSEAGHVALDCPLSGTGSQARVKDLAVYASGDAAAIEERRDLFAGFSRRMDNVGAFGNGSKMKFIANHLVAIHNVASAEAMLLGMKAGLDPHQLVELVGAGVGTSRVFDLRAPMMADDNYQPATMRISTWQKDMDIIGRFAAGLGAPTPLFSASAALYNAGMSLGLADQDTAAVCRVFETMTGTRRGEKA